MQNAAETMFQMFGALAPVQKLSSLVLSLQVTASLPAILPGTIHSIRCLRWIRTIRHPAVLWLCCQLAVIDVQDVSGAFQAISVLLDSGSQDNFISEYCLSHLGITRRKKTQPLQGLSQASLNIACGVVSCVLKPCGQTGTVYSISIDAFVLPRITGHFPFAPVDPQAWSHLAHLQLADLAFATPGSIDMLLDAELSPYLSKGNKCEGPPGTLVVLDTHFDWFVMGKVNSSLPHLQSSHISSFFVASSLLSPSLDTVVERHWKLYELPPDKPTNTITR
ncbi:hypothetical protein PR048_010416 [Dryococelus australis]|uniref:Peptidase aspartic putative domain-containing protein n=1 Tax=Dryococelus australis TaxID=614101 RepID=A0ABQ9I2S1_9NEOP|nr:hypothetical protein PR048_010416 [Dryococelus australis]